MIVTEVIHSIDPHGLLAGGAPRDEFDSEILALAGKVARCESPEDIAHAIAEVLNTAFSADISASGYTEEAAQLYSRLQREGML